MAAASAYYKVTQELYVSYFGRPADKDGFMSMSAALAAANAPTDTAGLDAAYRTDASVRSLFDSFSSSVESGVLYGMTAPGFDTVRFVSQIYNNLFGRTPDAGGLAFWVDAIDHGSLSQAAAAHSILTGALTANNADAALIIKKTAFANLFTAAMDTPQELIVYRGDMAAQFGRDLLSRVTTTSDPATFQTTIDSTLAQLSAASKLTVATDKLEGTSAANLFLADVDGNTNTLQSGDNVAGGDGVDTLRAVLRPNDFNVSLKPTTSSVEHIRVNAVGTTLESGAAGLDAINMTGVTRWESDHSRGDLFIANVTVRSGQLPEDTTIAMVGSAAGDADYSVTFDHNSMSAGVPATGSATLRLQVMDTNATAGGEAPLKESPYDGFRFLLNKVPVQIRSAAIDQAQTYDALLSAIRAQITATPALEKLVVTLGEPFNAYDTATGLMVSGREIIITNTGPGSLGVAPGAGWLQPGSGLEGTRVSGPSSGSIPLVTSTIELDNVGRGGIGGDLVVGGTPWGSTRIRTGFEAFNINVERTSMLQTIDTTDNLLQSVTLANGTIKGDLSVRGTVGGSPLSNAYGFHDVRQIDASAMSGKVDLTAVITAGSVTKYVSRPSTETGLATGTVDFHYEGGSNNDSLTIDIAHGAVGSRGVRATNQEDFRFDIRGGAGDDVLQVRVLAAPSYDAAWVIDQDRNHNLTISGGEGNDTIRKAGAGDAVIHGGAGDDTIDLVDPVAGAVQAASDNLIHGGIGNDTIVLGVVKGAAPAQSSNDTVILLPGFGNDKIVNFDVRGPGIDHLDLTGLGGLTLTASLMVDKSITIADASNANDTAPKVAALFSAENATAQTHVYGVLNSLGTSLVIYSVVDAVGAGNAVATREGTIDMSSQAAAGGLTAANFVNAAVAGYNQAEGASSAVTASLVGVAPDAMMFGMI